MFYPFSLLSRSLLLYTQSFIFFSEKHNNPNSPKSSDLIELPIISHALPLVLFLGATILIQIKFTHTGHIAFSISFVSVVSTYSDLNLDVLQNIVILICSI
ncbi:hypothetical protein ISN45_Aa07g038220 [Arabidopsis thaliana x Arabidopsis arenosa]|uniref:Transmembrane protein n=1 Tax=Arabidopsis thaliana x Arabidopsis arenosa TaxID=1240361 RepID=A0A8T1YDB4_9BRAS|nr:hypothetical protein ISN45_Aa07g038220 [Arabidopsis thaliana x Arabidopsis arenosa]KAG7543948.1 hypothetical protein ISN45_Aa07g038220 [Arabidopsis thaliana x Arabidopsis arenosa]